MPYPLSLPAVKKQKTEVVMGPQRQQAAVECEGWRKQNGADEEEQNERRQRQRSGPRVARTEQCAHGALGSWSWGPGDRRMGAGSGEQTWGQSVPETELRRGL